MVRAAPALGSVRKTERRWTARDWAAAAGLFAVTAAVILWQNAHVAVLWDLSYVLDTATRIAQGQMPYRDFPLAHPPGTFLVQAALIRLGGRVYWHLIDYAALMGGLGSVLAWRIVLEALRERVRAPWAISLLLAVPLAVLGIYCVFPHPSYDCDCAFWMLAAVAALQRLDTGNSRRGFTAGVLASVPLFFKQNMGLAFLAAVASAVAVLLIWSGIRRTESSPDAKALWALLGGATTALAAALLMLHFTAGIGNYIHWTIDFAAQRRLPALDAMLGVYSDPNLLWMLGCVVAGAYLLWRSRSKSPRLNHKNEDATQRVPKAGQLRSWLVQAAALFLFAAPFLWTLLSLLRFDDADERGDALLALWPLLLIAAAALALWNLLQTRRVTFRALLPLVLLAAVNGTLMSQQLWGSTYAIWPLLVLLLAEPIAALDARARPAWFTPATVAVVAVTLLVCGAFYTASEERLSYAQLPDGPAMHSASRRLAGLATPGPYLPEFDELLQYASAHIPAGDGLILLPGEDPFYFATGRVPQFPVLLFDPATDPYTPKQVAELVRSHGIRWMVVKRDLQSMGDPTPDRAALLAALAPEFTLAARLRGYDVYKNREQGTKETRERASRE